MTPQFFKTRCKHINFIVSKSVFVSRQLALTFFVLYDSYPFAVKNNNNNNNTILRMQ
jgi:hypothetical protein